MVLATAFGALWKKNLNCIAASIVCRLAGMDADAPVPLPKSAARQLSRFHLLMRSTRLGVICLVLVALGLAVKPLISAAPLLLFLSWIGLIRVRSMQRFFDLATGWYMAIIVVSFT